MNMNNFILNRPDDVLALPTKKIVGTTLKWLLILMGGAILLRIICVSVYMSMGIDPTQLTKFGGDPTSFKGNAYWKTILTLLLYAPLMEELMFRLGLSFKRTTVALWVGLLPLVCAFYLHQYRAWYILLALAAVGAVLFWLINARTTDGQWENWRRKYIIPAMWASAVGFGLVHLRAFTVLDWQVLPFALATILVPMAGGTVVTYVRVNLGFWWGVLLHALINVPSVLVIAASMAA